MTGSAIFMMVLAMVLLWGGAAYFLTMAMKRKF
ncbi:MetS family NSS transporter small subunit [Desulforamulus reducens]|nr:MetS family NSS transporter small subunit [Desulforamulus reducens]